MIRYGRADGRMKAALLFVLIAAAAHAATPEIKAAILARQANYKEIGGDFKAMKDEIKGGAPDLDTIRPSALDLFRRASGQGKDFLPGSGPDSGEKTRAKADIWSDRATFDKLHGEMLAEADILQQAAAKGDLAAVTSAHTALGRACKACHDKFREPE